MLKKLHYWRVRASLTGANPRDAGASKNGKDMVGTSKGCRCGGRWVFGGLLKGKNDVRRVMAAKRKWILMENSMILRF